MKKNKIEDMRITVLDYAIVLLGIVLTAYIVCVLIGCALLGVGLSGIMYVISNGYVLTGTLVITIVSCVPIAYVMRLRWERSYVMRRLKSMRAAVEGNLENAHFMTAKEMEQNGYRRYGSIEEIAEAEDGVLLNFEERRGKLLATFSPETIHTLVLGTTGSGKTATYIIPTINVLSGTRTKPSFVFTDPKGELYVKTSARLRAQGYEVKVLDFRHPERSLRWNPLAYAWEKYGKARQVWEELVFENGAYRYRGKTYSEAEIDGVMESEAQRLEDEAFEEITTVVSAICPVNERDPIWDNGAKTLIQAVCMAMLEDGAEGSGMMEEKYNFYNVAKICSKAGNGCEALKEYFAYRRRNSLAVQYSNMVLTAPDKQQGSYMSSVAEKLMMFNDRGICNMTSGNEIQIKEMDERPTAVYLVLPDEKEGRHPLGSLFITQAYKKLVEKAVENGGTLKRRTYFIMDEYGNMPKIEGVGSMFTVGRSRGIIQMPVIQSYSQLYDKYGQEMARTIFGNCNIEVFIGAKDDKTCEEFSKKLGNYTVLSTNVTGEKRAFEHNISESLKERPLMYPRELTVLNNKKDMGNAVIINQGYAPTLGKFTPYFKSDAFKPTDASFEENAARALDEEELYYDFEERGRDIRRSMEEAEQAAEPPQEEAVQEEKPQEDIEELLQKIRTLAGIEEEFTDDVQANEERIEAAINTMRVVAAEHGSIIKLNELLRLKSRYEAITQGEEHES